VLFPRKKKKVSVGNLVRYDGFTVLPFKPRALWQDEKTAAASSGGRGGVLQLQIAPHVRSVGDPTHPTTIG